MKIALVRPDFRGLTHQPDMPLGLLYIASYLEKHGYNPDVYDLNKQDIPVWTKYDIIGFSMLPLARKQVWELIDEIKTKKPSIKIVLGGVFPSSIPEFLIKNLNIDAIIVGEGEATFLDLVKHWESGKSIKEVKGICTKEYGLHESRPLIDINTLPHPAWYKSNFDWFHMTFADNFPDFKTSNGIILSKEKLAMVISARGCPNFQQCQFCNTPSFWQYKYRIRTAENLLQEIEELYYKYNIRVFSFNDDCFPVNKKQCIGFCKRIINKSMKIAWKSDTRADVLDEEMIMWMKKAGCFMIAIGIESASEKIRNTIHKNLDINKAKETIKLLKKHGILAYVLLMVGNVGETKETILETKKFLQEIQPDLATWVTGVMICAGTELYDIAKKEKLINDDYWIKKGNEMPIYQREHTMEELLELSKLLNGWKK